MSARRILLSQIKELTNQVKNDKAEGSQNNVKSSRDDGHDAVKNVQDDDDEYEEESDDEDVKIHVTRGKHKKHSKQQSKDSTYLKEIRQSSASISNTSQSVKFGKDDGISGHERHERHVKSHLNVDDNMDVEWVDEVSEHAKDLDDDERRQAHDNDDDTGDYDIPDDVEDIDVDVLASLPTNMRKHLIDEARRRDRMRSRSNFMPVAGDLKLYSQTQIANFLNRR